MEWYCDKKYCGGGVVENEQGLSLKWVHFPPFVPSRIWPCFLKSWTFTLTKWMVQSSNYSHFTWLFWLYWLSKVLGIRISNKQRGMLPNINNFISSISTHFFAMPQFFRTSLSQKALNKCTFWEPIFRKSYLLRTIKF